MSSKDLIDAAGRLVAEILSAIRALVAFPRQGHRRPDLTSRPLRFILVREYLIAYAPFESIRKESRPWTKFRFGCALNR